MYNIKKKNKILYKIYNKIIIDKKKFSLIGLSYGIDSNLSNELIRKIKKNIKIVNINHRLNVLDKKLYRINKKNILKLKIKFKKNIEKNLKEERFKKIKYICRKLKNNI